MAPKVLHGFCRRIVYEAGGEEGGAVAHKTPKSTIDLLRDFLFPAPFFLFSPFFRGKWIRKKLGEKWGSGGHQTSLSSIFGFFANRNSTSFYLHLTEILQAFAVREAELSDRF